MAKLGPGIVVERAQEVAREILAPNAEKIDQEAKWPKENLQALQDAGLGGLVISEKQGGLGHGLEALARVCEVLGSTCASTAMCYGMHCVGAAVISARANDYQEQQYLQPINEGRHITTLALSEPGSGVHLYLPQTQLTEHSSHKYEINGEKTFVTNGAHADSYVISVVKEIEENSPGEFSCLVVDNDNPALKWGPEWQGLGLRGNSSRSVELNKMLVPKKDLLGKEGDQIWYIFNIVVPYFLTAMSGTYLGIATSAIESATEHLQRRRHSVSGNSLAQQQILQHRLGVLWAKVERTRRLLYYAASKGDLGDDTDYLPAIFSVKAEVADCAVGVANEAMTLMGGIAYRENGALHRNLRDARAAHIMAPPTDLLRIWTGRALLNLPILGD